MRNGRRRRHFDNRRIEWMETQVTGWKCVAALAALAIAEAVGAADDGRVLVGQTVALSGPIAEHGKAAATGARVLFESVNAAGGVHGRRIVVVAEDDAGDAKRAAENTRRLIEREGVIAMFGGVEGGPCVASLREAAALGAPLVACMAGAPEMREPFNAWSFPVRAPHLEEFAKLLDVAKTYGYGRVAFFHADSDTGQRHLANVQKLAAARSIEVVPVVARSGATPESLAQAIGAAKVDAVFNHGSYAVYAPAIKAAKAAGIRPTFMAVNSGAAQMAALLGADGKGLIFTQVVPFPWSVAVPVVKEYQQALARHAAGTAPSFSGLEGYLSAKVLVAGLRAAGRDPTRERLQKALESLGSMDLGGMTVRYSPTTHAGSTFVDTVIVASDGRFSR
jgi:ABC-type branched-subunit amino acid transport system substrate-binding protein